MVVRFRHSMADYVQDYLLCGLTGNADIARILAEGYDMPIEAADVARWRRQHARFDAKCTNAQDALQAVSMGVVGRAIKDGDVTTARWYLERTNANFKPSSKVDMSNRIEGLGDMLSRRMTEDELRKQGVLSDDDD